MNRPIVLLFLVPFVLASTLASPAHGKGVSQEVQSDAPAAAGDGSTGKCGFLSTRQGVTPESENVYSANITQIDGRSTSFMRSNRLQVSEGPHELTVAELIDQKHMTNAQLAQVRKMKKFAHAKAYKTLVVDVKPDVTYRIGSRLHTDKLDSQSIKSNAYWEPIVWQEVSEHCP